MKTSTTVIIVIIASTVCSVDGCRGGFRGVSRMLGTVSQDIQRRMSSISNSLEDEPQFIRINAPGQRFTATHGIALRKGQVKNFVFVVDRSDVNYLAISSNIALEGLQGGPEHYDIFMKFGKPPKPSDYDLRSTLTASESYIGEVLYSRDISITKPREGPYYFQVVAKKDFHELLITAIMDTPPEKDDPEFQIRRLGMPL